MRVKPFISAGRATGEGELAGTKIMVVMPSIPVHGMERSNLQIMKMMREQGAQVLFLTEKTYGQKIQEEVEGLGLSWIAISCERNLHLPKSLREGSSMLRYWLGTAVEMARIYKTYKPTHIHITNLAYFIYALPLLLFAKARVIFRLPNPPDTTLTNYKQAISNRIWRYCVAPFCDLLVCNSRYTLLKLKEIGVDTSKARVIYNCVPERNELTPSAVPNVRPDCFNVVYLGRIRAEKGVGELFAAAKRMVQERDDVDFYFAGEKHWENPFAEALQEEVRAGKLESRIQFCGELQDVFELLARCDLHVLPSLSSTHESFPNVVLEAKSKGVPSVVFPTNGVPEAVTHLVDGYICSNTSAEALYQGITYFLQNPALLEEAGKAASSSLENFSRRAASEKWAEVYRH